MDIDKLKKQWHVVAISKEASKRPIRVVLFSLPIVIYRDQDKIHAFQDRCPHRNFPLSKSSRAKDGLRCNYHGWKYDNQGFLIEIPGLPDDANLPSCKLKRIACMEYDDLIWICLSETEATLSPSTLKEGYHSQHFFYMASSVGAEYVSAFENLLDGFHTSYVHYGFVRGRKKKNKISARLERSKNSVEIIYTGEERQTGVLSRIFEPTRQKSIGRFVFPSIAQLEYWGKEPHFVLEAFAAPENERKINFILRISTKSGLLPSWLKMIVLKPFLSRILKQDKKVLETQRKNIEVFGENQFLIAPTDFIRPAIEYLTTESSPTKPSTAHKSQWTFDL